MKEIQLGHHQEGRKYKNPIMYALVDDEDFEELNKHNWYVKKRKDTSYAARNSKIDGKKVEVKMHRVIMQTPEGFDTDHKDLDGLNNQRSNLRIATRSQNIKNQGTKSSNTSGFKGVSWHKKDKKWQTRIKINGKQKHLGNFTTPELASEAYIAACKEYNGEFARY